MSPRPLLPARIPVVLLLASLWLAAGPAVSGAAAENDAVADYAKALKSKNAAVRKQVALALGEMGAQARAAVPALRAALLDPDEGVQAAAAAALEKISPAPAKPADPEAARKDPDSRQAERDELARLLREKDARIADLEKRVAAERDRAVAAQVEAATLKRRNEDLAAQVERQEKALARLKVGGGAGPAKADAKNPPTEEVEGVVKSVEAGTGLIKLSVGADAGLAKGHTLEVFRLDPPKYLGTVRLVDVVPSESVAQPVGKLAAPARPGDRVGSKLPAK
jgi:hypothetical protein